MRPEAFSIVCTIDCASSSESSYDVVSSTERRFCDCATSASSSVLISGISPARPFSAASRTKLRTSSSAVRGQLREHLGLACRVDLRVAEERAQLGHLVHRCRERAESAATASTRSGLLRRLEERAGVHALRDGH